MGTSSFQFSGNSLEPSAPPSSIIPGCGTIPLASGSNDEQFTNLIKLIRFVDGALEIDAEATAGELFLLCVSGNDYAPMVMHHFLNELYTDPTSEPIKKMALSILLETLKKLTPKQKEIALLLIDASENLTFLKKMLQEVQRINSQEIVRIFWNEILCPTMEQMEPEKQEECIKIASKGISAADIRFLMIDSSPFLDAFLQHFERFSSLGQELLSHPEEWAQIFLRINQQHPAMLDGFVRHFLDQYRWHTLGNGEPVTIKEPMNLTFTSGVVCLLENIDNIDNKEKNVYLHILGSILLYSLGLPNLTNGLDFFMNFCDSGEKSLDLFIRFASFLSSEEIQPTTVLTTSQIKQLEERKNLLFDKEIILWFNLNICALLKNPSLFCQLFDYLSVFQKERLLLKINDNLSKNCQENGYSQQSRDRLIKLLTTNSEFSGCIAATCAELNNNNGRQWFGLKEIRRDNEKNYTLFGQHLFDIEAKYKVPGSICEKLNGDPSSWTQSKTRRKLIEQEKQSMTLEKEKNEKPIFDRKSYLASISAASVRKKSSSDKVSTVSSSVPGKEKENVFPLTIAVQSNNDPTPLPPSALACIMTMTTPYLENPSSFFGGASTKNNNNVISKKNLVETEKTEEEDLQKLRQFFEQSPESSKEPEQKQVNMLETHMLKTDSTEAIKTYSSFSSNSGKQLTPLDPDRFPNEINQKHVLDLQRLLTEWPIVPTGVKKKALIFGGNLDTANEEDNHKDIDRIFCI